MVASWFRWRMVPTALKKIDGIDPSFFFDDNGKGYIVHNGPVAGGADYEGQRAIRCFEFDVKGDSIKGDFKEILRGGTHVEARPIWIEGPHLFKKGKFYYLMCAEGGTGGIRECEPRVQGYGISRYYRKE